MVNNRLLYTVLSLMKIASFSAQITKFYCIFRFPFLSNRNILPSACFFDCYIFALGINSSSINLLSNCRGNIFLILKFAFAFV